MKFKATPSLLQLLWSQIEEFPSEYDQEGEAGFPGGSVYEKLGALSGGGTIDITETERKELASLLDSIVGSGGWDTITPAEKRTGRAALRQVRA